jgi:hypothetical protein
VVEESVEDEARASRGLDSGLGTRLFQLDDCEGLAATFYYESASVAAALPPNYQAFSYFDSRAITWADFLVVTCDVSIAQTSYTGVPLAWTSIRLQGCPDSSADDAYLFEWILPVGKAPEFAAALSARGWPVVDAEITLSESEATVVGDTVDYRITLGPVGEGNGLVFSPLSERIRLHHGPEPGTFLDSNTTFDVADMTGAIAVASSGALARLAPAGLVPAGGGSGFLGSTFKGQFFEPPV